MREVFVGRQAIYDRERRVVGWELLFRNAGGVRGEMSDGNAATSQTLVNSIVEIGLDRVAAGGEPVYLNCTREFLEQPPPVPADRCVLEVLEDIPVDDGLLGALDRLRGQRYQIALDDFVFEPRLAALVRRAHIVKLDVKALGLEALAHQVRALAPFRVRLLAEKIDSEEQLEACRRMGFEMFQGYYLRRPDTLKARSAQTNKLSVLVLLAECQKETADIDGIARILSSDPGLSFKTLQLANSAMFQLSKPISSLTQAVSVIGLDALARWSTLLVLAGLENCPRSYLERALERGRMCELLAGHTGVSEKTAHLVGLLSILDAAMETPIGELAPRLPVSSEIKTALADHAGSLGRLLNAVIAHESGQPAEMPVPAEVFERCFWEACGYAHQTALKMGLKQVKA